MTDQTTRPTGTTVGEAGIREVVRVTETRTGFKTTEFVLAVAFAVAVIIAAYTRGDDSITRSDGWWYATIVVTGYLVSRGLAKAGSPEDYAEDVR